MSGWFKLHRKLFTHYLWEENRKLSKFEAWIDLLQLVSYTKNNSQMISGIKCDWGRGQYPVSILFLSKRWGWTEKPVRNFLKLLEKDRMIRLDRSSKWTMLTICNYDSYQNQGQSEGKSKGNHEAVIKEVKEKKEVYSDILESWVEYRKQLKKPLTDKGIETLVKKLSSKPLHESEWVIEHSIENGWTGLFWEHYTGQETLKALTPDVANFILRDKAQLDKYINKGYTEEQIKNYAK